MTSSFNALADLLEEQFADFDMSSSTKQSSSQSRKGQQKSFGSASESSFSFDSINDLLNIQRSEKAQVEGGLLLSTLVGKRFFAFDNHTIEQLPECKYHFTFIFYSYNTIVVVISSSKWC